MNFQAVKTVEADGELRDAMARFQVVVVRPLTYAECIAEGCTDAEAMEYFKANVRTVVELVEYNGRRVRLEASK